MSARKAKAARKAADPTGYFKEQKRPTQKYQSKRDAQADRAMDVKVANAVRDVILHGKGTPNESVAIDDYAGVNDAADEAALDEIIGRPTTN